MVNSSHSLSRMFLHNSWASPSPSPVQLSHAAAESHEVPKARFLRLGPKKEWERPEGTRGRPVARVELLRCWDTAPIAPIDPDSMEVFSKEAVVMPSNLIAMPSNLVMPSNLIAMASNLVAMASNLVAMASNLIAMASNLVAMASNLVAMAFNLIAMASNLVAMASNLVAMASNLIAMASNLIASCY